MKKVLFPALLTITNFMMAMQSSLESIKYIQYPPISWEPYVKKSKNYLAVLGHLTSKKILDTRDEKGDTAMLACTRYGQSIPHFVWLKDNSLFEDTNSLSKETYLMLLCQNSKNSDCGSFSDYISAGAKTGAQDIKGETVLMKAIQYKNSRGNGYIKILLDTMPITEVVLQDLQGKTAFDHAIDSDNASLIELLALHLLQAQEKVSLTYAIQQNKPVVLELLMRKGVVPTFDEIECAQSEGNSLIANYLSNVQTYHTLHASLPHSEAELEKFLKESQFQESLLCIAYDLDHKITLNIFSHWANKLIPSLDHTLQDKLFKYALENNHTAWLNAFVSLLSTLDYMSRDKLFKHAINNNHTAWLDAFVSHGSKTYYDILKICCDLDTKQSVDYALSQVLAKNPHFSTYMNVKTCWTCSCENVECQSRGNYVGCVFETIAFLVWWLPFKTFKCCYTHGFSQEDLTLTLLRDEACHNGRKYFLKAFDETLEKYVAQHSDAPDETTPIKTSHPYPQIDN